jgi:small-conductance mechanosensitive channel/CRP-like cAMP-binding protein
VPLLVAFLKGEYASGALGIFVSVALLALVRALLPRAEHDRSRIAGIYLVLAVGFGLADWFAPTGSAIARVAAFFFWFFVLASGGRSLVLLAVDVAFGRKTHRAPPRIFRDLTQAVVYLIVLMLTLRAIGVEPSSLLTTSALLTAVVGLALQDTLGNLVSGLALQMQRPFEVGDWIQFDPEARQIGQVTEVNWRATTVMTSDLVEVIVPNAMLARAAIRNYSRPSRVSRRTVSVQGSYDASPHRVADAIQKALVGAPGLISDPAPWVQTKSFGDSGIEYTVFFFVDDFASRERTDGLVRDRVWYAMQRAKIAIPYPIRTVHVHEVSKETRAQEHEQELDRRDQVLRCVDFLDVLPSAAHRALAAGAEVRLFAPGEVIVTEGEASAEMFVIDRGTVAVELVRAGRSMTVARLGAGKFFGEMALMTGEARKATVRALTECALIVIARDVFQQTIATVPGVVEKMSGLLAVRQAELEEIETSRPTLEPMQERSQRLISQIKGFFNI